MTEQMSAFGNGFAVERENPLVRAISEFSSKLVLLQSRAGGRPSSSRFGTSRIHVPVSLTISPTQNPKLSDIYVTRTSTHWTHAGSIVRFSGAFEMDGRRQCARGGDTRSVHFYTHCLK